MHLTLRKKCMKLSAGPLQIHLSPCIDDVQWLCAFIHSLLQADNQVRNKSLKHIPFYSIWSFHKILFELDV